MAVKIGETNNTSRLFSVLVYQMTCNLSISQDICDQDGDPKQKGMQLD